MAFHSEQKPRSLQGLQDPHLPTSFAYPIQPRQFPCYSSNTPGSLLGERLYLSIPSAWKALPPGSHATYPHLFQVVVQTPPSQWNFLWPTPFQTAISSPLPSLLTDYVLRTELSHSLSKFIYWSPNPQCDSIWRCGLWEVSRFRWSHEGEALVMELVPLQEKEETPGCSLYHVRTQWERHLCKPGRETSLETKSAYFLFDF